MKAPPKILIGSSPGRPEKLPAPTLSKLLKGRGANRSRGRSHHHSRSSPMFTTRRRSTEPEDKEPTSPKVTCIGQVRINKNKKKKKKKNRDPSDKNNHTCCCYCNETSASCNHFSILSRFQWPDWRRWLMCYCKREPIKKAQALNVNPTQEHEEGEETEQCNEAKTEEAVAGPPKNALLLMRCRSAPHRGSSIAARFVEEAKEIEVEPVDERSGTEEVEDRVGPSRSFSSRPLILTRCKSEPARRAAAKMAVRGGERKGGCGRYYSPSKSRRLLALADEGFPRPLAQ